MYIVCLPSCSVPLRVVVCWLCWLVAPGTSCVSCLSDCAAVLCLTGMLVGVGMCHQVGCEGGDQEALQLSLSSLPAAVAVVSSILRRYRIGSSGSGPLGGLGNERVAVPSAAVVMEGVPGLLAGSLAGCI